MTEQDIDAPERETKAEWNYWADRPSSRTEAERELAFQRYIESTTNYFAAIEAAGDRPWFNSEAERRDLYFRRYTGRRHPLASHRST